MFFRKRKKRLPFYSEAINEGFKDIFREMGYRFDKKTD
jgi:hypothetical protein